jgi:hypothetical protein
VGWPSHDGRPDLSGVLAKPEEPTGGPRQESEALDRSLDDAGGVLQPLATTEPASERGWGRVVEVVDGDTMKVEPGERPSRTGVRACGAPVPGPRLSGAPDSSPSVTGPIPGLKPLGG